MQDSFVEWNPDLGRKDHPLHRHFFTMRALYGKGPFKVIRTTDTVAKGEVLEAMGGTSLRLTLLISGEELDFSAAWFIWRSP